MGGVGGLAGGGQAREVHVGGLERLLDLGLGQRGAGHHGRFVVGRDSRTEPGHLGDRELSGPGLRGARKACGAEGVVGRGDHRGRVTLGALELTDRGGVGRCGHDSLGVAGAGGGQPVGISELRRVRAVRRVADAGLGARTVLSVLAERLGQGGAVDLQLATDVVDPRGEGRAGLAVLHERGRQCLDGRSQGGHPAARPVHAARARGGLVEALAGLRDGRFEGDLVARLVAELLAELDQGGREGRCGAFDRRQLLRGPLPRGLRLGDLLRRDQVGRGGEVGVVLGAADRARLVVLEPAGQLAGHGVESSLAAVLVEVAQVLGRGALRGQRGVAGRLAVECLVEAAAGSEQRTGALQSGGRGLQLRRALLCGGQGGRRLGQLRPHRGQPLGGLCDAAGRGGQLALEQPGHLLPLVHR